MTPRHRYGLEYNDDGDDDFRDGDYDDYDGDVNDCDSIAMTVTTTPSVSADETTLVTTNNYTDCGDDDILRRVSCLTVTR